MPALNGAMRTAGMRAGQLKQLLGYRDKAARDKGLHPLQGPFHGTRGVRLRCAVQRERLYFNGLSRMSGGNPKGKYGAAHGPDGKRTDMLPGKTMGPFTGTVAEGV